MIVYVTHNNKEPLVEDIPLVKLYSLLGKVTFKNNALQYCVTFMESNVLCLHYFFLSI